MEFKTLLLKVIEVFDREPDAFPFHRYPELSRLTVIQARYLEAMGQAGRTTVSQLARELKVTKPTVSVIIDRLEGMGLVKKEQSPDDGRVYDLSLSARGRKLYRIYRAYDEKMNAEIVEKIRRQLSAADEKKLTEILARLVKGM